MGLPKPKKQAPTAGQLIRTARDRKGWSRDRLAREIEVAHNTIVNIESDSVVPSLVTAARIAEVLEIEWVPLLKAYTERGPTNRCLFDTPPEHPLPRVISLEPVHKQHARAQRLVHGVAR